MSPGSTGTGDCAMIAPWSYSSSTKCTVAPLIVRARREDRFVHVMAVHAGAAERGEQRGMDVDDAARGTRA